MARNEENSVNFRKQYPTEIIGLLVALNGVYIIASTLIEQLTVYHNSRLTNLQVDIPLLLGISVIYLSTLLARRKRTAWIVTVLAYALYFGIGIAKLFSHPNLHYGHHHEELKLLDLLLRTIIFPCILLALLLIYQHKFIVKSDIRGFGVAVRFSIIVLLVAFIYGVVGFQLLDTSDFHQEIGLPSAIHYTIDQFNVTTNKPLHPYTKRAHLFVDSLSFISTAAVLYALLSLFQPIRSRFGDQTAARKHMYDLLKRYGAPSEEFFKLWPYDKQYFFSRDGQSGIAFRVHHSVALCVSDPAGDPLTFQSLILDFQEMCFHNDWLPAFIHISDQYRHIYEKHNFFIQKLGQEAVVDISHFNSQTAKEKYFRQISNRFDKHGYSTELMKPPHHEAVLNRLSVISKEWLSQGSRSERGFAMGYYTTEYMQQCEVLVARDAAGTIQAFLNLVPADFDHEEATYDLLRQAKGSLGNINDYLLISLMKQLENRGYKRLNLGLAPLVGLKNEDSQKKTLIDNVLQFAYANGDMFYSFSGLYRFKAKYEPNWQDRFVAYQDGMRGFSRTMTALTRLMRKVIK
jgi:phosphatidylglycerol lysyltransferase